MTAQKLSPLFSSSKHDWETPPEFFARYNSIWRFTLDACATRGNAKCPHYFSPDESSLTKDWHGVVWMNPPYGREIGNWVSKAAREVSTGNAEVVVGLLPSRTDTAWWHNYVQPVLDGQWAGSVDFIKGRLRFVGAKSGAPFPSVVVTWMRGSWKIEALKPAIETRHASNG